MSTNADLRPKHTQYDDAALWGMREYSERVRRLLATGSYADFKPVALVHTFGCQQNVSDSEKIKGMLSQMGYSFTDDPARAGLILYNTCAVREHAQLKVFGNVGALKQYKESDRNLIIGLCGCMMQQEHVAEKIKKSYPFVELVFGTHTLHRLPEMLFSLLTSGERIFDISQAGTPPTEGLPVRRDGKYKAWLPIMYGCDNFCSYCVVPLVRGRERSREYDDILREAKELVDGGYKEITLLGQNVNSYGKTLQNPVSFARLLEGINAIPGEFLIRFMTSHPKDCTHELLDTIARCEKVERHLHLPFQAGCDRVLSAMNRGYTYEQYVELAEYARRKIPGLSLTSDVIVGFPGETYEDFRETLRLIERVEFTSLYTFIFSPREDTPAAKMRDDIPKEEKSRWFQELLDTQERIAAARTARTVGQVFRVLAEEKTQKGFIKGRTSGNIIIEFDGADGLIGQFVDVKVTRAMTWILKGEINLINN